MLIDDNEHHQILYMRVVGVVRLSHLGHPNGTLAKNPKPCHCQFCTVCIGCHHYEALACLCSSPINLLLQWMSSHNCREWHPIVEICLYSSKLVVNATFKLCIWCFAIWALRWWSIKIQGASQLDFSCSRESTFKLEQTSPIIKGKYLFVLCLLFLLCAFTLQGLFSIHCNVQSLDKLL
jgi:hypothetical protein